MANTDRKSPGAGGQPLHTPGTLPTRVGGAGYLDELGRYFDRLLDEALPETPSAGERAAVSSRRGLARK